MKFSGLLLLAAAASLGGASASAAPSKHVSAAKGSAPTTGLHMDAPPNLDAMLAFVDKLFPPQPEPDPARLALARPAVQAMWPDGAYGSMMTGLMGGIYDRVMTLKGSDFASLGGPAAKGGGDKADASLHDGLVAKDPYYDQSAAAVRSVMTVEAGKMSAIVDPRMRDGLARAMAHRFDAKQLTDIGTFFATPSGHALASQYMQLWLDPALLRSLFDSMPEMMKLAPEMMEKVKAANDKFPAPAGAAKH